MTACRYFDGTSSRAHVASMEVADDGLRIVGEGFDRVVPAADLDFAPATDRGPARIAFHDGGLCEIDDRVAADALFARLGHRRARSERIATRTSHAVAIAGVFVATLALLYWWGIPWIADTAASHVPAQWDEALGAHVLESLDQQKFLRPSNLPQATRDRIAARFAALRWPTTAATTGLRKPLEFRQLGAPNAFALPGGTIVVTDEIVAIAASVDDRHDDAALLAVLAHEAGHLRHRDAMRQLARGTLMSILTAWYLGDASSAFAVVAGGIGGLHYSRDTEHEADLYAVETMQFNRIETRPAADLFRRLQDWRPPVAAKKPADPKPNDPKAGPKPNDRTRRPASSLPEYLSTHPATEDRIRLFEQGHA